MSSDRRVAFERARRPVAVAMRVVAEALAAFDPQPGTRRSVFNGPRNGRRVAVRDATPATPRGCEDLH